MCVHCDTWKKRLWIWSHLFFLPTDSSISAPNLSSVIYIYIFWFVFFKSSVSLETLKGVFFETPPPPFFFHFPGFQGSFFVCVFPWNIHVFSHYFYLLKQKLFFLFHLIFDTDKMKNKKKVWIICMNWFIIAVKLNIVEVSRGRSVRLNFLCY